MRCGCRWERAARGTSFRRWSQWLELRAQDAACVGELSFWSGMLSERSLSLVDGALDAARDTIGTTGRLTLTLPAAVTQALLTRVPAAFHCGIQHVLVTGLALAVAQWCGRRGRGGRTAATPPWRFRTALRSMRSRLMGRREPS